MSRCGWPKCGLRTGVNVSANGGGGGSGDNTIPDPVAPGGGSGGIVKLGGGAIGGHPLICRYPGSVAYDHGPGGQGGNGGKVLLSVAVTPGDTYTIVVGAGGIGGTSCPETDPAGADGEDGYVILRYVR